MKRPPFLINDHEWAKELEKGLEEYMDTLAMGVDSDEDAETETGVPYCGCSDCHSRETISWLVPRIAQGLKTGKITAV